MAIKENQSNSELYIIEANIVSVSASDQSTGGFDTTGFNNGVSFIPWWADLTGAGNVTLAIAAVQDSDDNITFATIPANQVVTSDLSFFDDIPQILPDPTPQLLHTIGVVGTRRYVRLLYDVTIGGGEQALISVLVNGDVEIKPGNS